MKKAVCVLGHHGFIGNSLTQKLSETEDVVFTPSRSCKIIYDFASPTHESFETNIDYNFNSVITRMAYLMRFCADNKIKYVYPSSALVYELDRPFKAFKVITEMMQKLFPADCLALRIFPVYGVGETRTVIYQWCKDVKTGKRPVVFGNGTQTRDFIYIDDVVDNIIRLSKTKSGIADIGAGKPYKFNQIVKIINQTANTKLKPVYVKPPAIYSPGISCPDPVKCKVDLNEGVKRVLASI